MDISHNSFYVISLMLLIKSLLILSIPKYNGILSKTDCYQSFSNPTQYLEFSHNYPIGPVHLYVKFNYILYFIRFDIPLIDEDESYHFKRINGSCRNTFKFTNGKTQFTLIDLTINIYLFHPWNEITTIKYKFYNGFNSGYYLMLGKNSNFGIFVEVLNFGDEYIQKINYELSVDWNYLGELSINYNYLCIITENNNFAIMKPYYDDGQNHNLIYSISAEYVNNDNIYYRFEYTAYECLSDEVYYNKDIFVVEDNYTDLSLRFEVYYHKIENKSIKISLNNFKIPNIRRISVKESLYLRENFMKIFLIAPTQIDTNLPGGITRTSYSSESDIIYYITEKKYDQVGIDVVRLNIEEVIIL